MIVSRIYKILSTKMILIQIYLKLIKYLLIYLMKILNIYLINLPNIKYITILIQRIVEYSYYYLINSKLRNQWKL